MKKILLIMLLLTGIILLSCGKSKKVLVRNTYRTNAGIEGDVSGFVEYKYGIDRVDEDIKEKIQLTTDFSITVENEWCTEIPRFRGDTFKIKSKNSNDPKNFDFLVNFYSVWKKKKLFGSYLDPYFKIKEIWEVINIKDTTNKKYWEINYQLDKIELNSGIQKYDSDIQIKINEIILPLRAPIIKEIREFINEHSNK
ncbi:MAG: hypothetical protein V1779_07990 [bacterium]